MKPAAAVKKSPGAASVAWDPSSFGQSMASIVAVLSFGLVCMALGGLFSHVDTRLILTASENFAGLAEIRDIFKQTLNLTVAVNPAGVDHVPYPTVPETYVEVEDLHKRGLMDAATFASFKPLNSTYDVSLLRQLLRASWCSGMPWITGSLPARRTPGCQCIADAYLDFVGSSLAESPGNNGVIYPSAGLRERVSSRVYRCWDLRQVRRSRTCGNVCKTHVVGLALFADIVLFLTSAAFLVFYSASLRERYGMVSLKLIVALLAGVASIPFFVRYPEANSINVAAVVVCVLYLVVGLHEELDMLGMQDALNVLYQKTLADGRPIPNPFMVCVLVTLPLVLSSHTIQLGVSGYARDVWALFSFGLCGGLLGLLLQVPLNPLSTPLCSCSIRFLFTCFFLFVLRAEVLLDVLLREPGAVRRRQDGQDGPAGGLRVRADPADPPVRGVPVRRRAVPRGGPVRLHHVPGLPHSPGSDPRLRSRGSHGTDQRAGEVQPRALGPAGLVHPHGPGRQRGLDRRRVSGRHQPSQLDPSFFFVLFFWLRLKSRTCSWRGA